MELEEAIERLKRRIEDTMFSTLYSQEQEEEDIKTVLKELNRKNRIINTLQCTLKERTDERDKKDDEISKLRAVITKQEKMIQKIHENFCKFDWKNSNGEQVHNQLKELYESIFKNEESE